MKLVVVLLLCAASCWASPTDLEALADTLQELRADNEEVVESENNSIAESDAIQENDFVKLPQNLPLPVVFPMNVPSPRVVNGNQACKGQIPYQVLIILDNAYLCGGSLISDEYVLTAAHCVVGFKSYRVQVGSNFLNAEDPDRATLIATQVTPHPQYIADTLENDIALIRLPECITFNYNIQPIRLSECETPAGVEVTVSGWGENVVDKNGPLNLQYTSVVTITNKQCTSLYGSIVRVTNICTTFSQSSLVQGACQGDSGGPLVANFGGEPVLVGVVSFVNGIGCGEPYPSGFTNVHVYRGWIRDNSGI